LHDGVYDILFMYSAILARLINLYV